MKFKNIGAVLLLVTATTYNTAAVSQTVLMSDDFEGLDGAAALVGNDWLYQKTWYNDVGCTDFAGVYAVSQVAPQAAQNHNYTTVTNGTYPEYTNQGVEAYNDNAVVGNISLNVMNDSYSSNTAKDACHRSRTFKDYTATDLESGTYKISAKTSFTRYGDAVANPSGVTTGVVMFVLDADNLENEAEGYGVLLEAFRPNPVTRADGVIDVSEEFEVELGSATNVIVRAGFYTQAGAEKSGAALWDSFEVSYVSLSEEEAAAEAAELAACEDTSVLRFEDAFGDKDPVKKSDMVTCLTDTYTWPTGAEAWAGFGDTKRGDQYPFYFPEEAGSVSFNCSTEAGTAKVRFKFENAAFPNNSENYYTDYVECSAGQSRSSQSVTIPSGETVWGNMLMYVGTRDVPVKVENITVNGSRDYVAPIPALPIWSLLGLTGLVGFMGLRRRRKQ